MKVMVRQIIALLFAIPIGVIGCARATTAPQHEFQAGALGDIYFTRTVMSNGEPLYYEYRIPAAGHRPILKHVVPRDPKYEGALVSGSHTATVSYRQKDIPLGWCRVKMAETVILLAIGSDLYMLEEPHAGEFLALVLKSRREVAKPDTAFFWQELLQMGGCLTGSQDWAHGRISEGSVLRDRRWQEFLKRPASEVVPFAIDLIDSVRPTGFHVCPYQAATEGEMAVYILQHSLGANWVDMSSEHDVVEEAKALHKKHRQNAVRDLLDDPTGREELKRYFRLLLDKEQESHEGH